MNQGGRTSNKPILWSYLDNQNRKNLNETWSKLIKLKLKYEIFEASDFTLDVGNSNGLNKIHLTDPSAADIQNVVIIGNFSVTTQSITPYFQQTGTWYNLLEDNATITVTNTTATISLAPGEFKVYANKPATLSTDDNFLDDSTLQLYPNPTSSSFTLSQEVQEVSLFDVTGKQLKKFTKNIIKNNTYSVIDLNKGIYFILIKDKNNQVQTKKLIIN